MKKLFILTTALVAIGAAPALAADLAARPYTKAPPLPAPVMTWTGFYLGVQGGGGWGRSDETFFGAPNTAAFVGTQNYDITGVPEQIAITEQALPLLTEYGLNTAAIHLLNKLGAGLMTNPSDDELKSFRAEIAKLKTRDMKSGVELSEPLRVSERIEA